MICNYIYICVNEIERKKEREKKMIQYQLFFSLFELKLNNIRSVINIY